MINKKEVKTKKMTIDKLAIMMSNSFGSIEKRMATKDDIEEVKEKIDKVNRRMDDYAETKVSKITYKGLENRVDSLEEKLEIK